MGRSQPERREVGDWEGRGVVGRRADDYSQL